MLSNNSERNYRFNNNSNNNNNITNNDNCNPEKVKTNQCIHTYIIINREIYRLNKNTKSKLKSIKSIIKLST